MASITQLSNNAPRATSAGCRALERKMIDDLMNKVNFVPEKSNAQKAIERMNAHAMDKSLMMRDCTKSALQQSLLFGAFNYESPIDKILREQREFEERIYGTAKLTNTLRADIAKSIAIEANKKSLLALVGLNPDQWLRIPRALIAPHYRRIKQQSDYLAELFAYLKSVFHQLTQFTSQQTALFLRWFNFQKDSLAVTNS